MPPVLKAAGLMQLMPNTAENYGLVDRYHPHKNIDTGTKQLRYLLNRYNNNLQLALAAYNAERPVSMNMPASSLQKRKTMLSEY